MRLLQIIFMSFVLCFANNQSVNAQIKRTDLETPVIEIGHESTPVISLLASQGTPFGRATFHGTGEQANDWVEKISSPESGISWQLAVSGNKIYAIIIEYAYTGKATATTALRLNFSNKRRQLYIKEFPNVDLLTPDQAEPKEVYPRTWQIVRNNVSLPAGLYDFKVAMDEETEQGFLAVKSVTLKRIN